jgi:hypothetical protein
MVWVLGGRQGGKREGGEREECTSAVPVQKWTMHWEISDEAEEDTACVQ